MKKTIIGIFVLGVLVFTGFYFFRLRGSLKKINQIENGQYEIDTETGNLARNQIRELGIPVAEGKAKLIIEADEGIIFSVYAPDETTTDMEKNGVLGSTLTKGESGWRFEQKNPFMGSYEILYRAEQPMMGKISITSYDENGRMFFSSNEYSVLTENSIVILHNNPFEAEKTSLD